MAFLRHGCDVSAVCPPGHTLAQVPGIGTLYRYRRLRSLQSLRRAILTANPDFLIPCDDGVVRQLHTLHAREPSLRPLIERSLGSPEAYAILDDRDQLLRIAAELGLRTPFTHVVSSEAGIAAWPKTSAVLKTDGSTGGNGVAITHSLEERLTAYRKLAKPLTAAIALKRFFIDRNPLSFWLWQTQAKPSVVLQEFIPGRPANTMIACWQGEVLASVTVEVIASQGATGAATVVRFLHNPEIEQASCKLARSLRLTGFHGLDFMLEHTENPSVADAAYLIELNPRCTQLGHLLLPGQGDLAGILAAKLAGNEIGTGNTLAQPIAGDTVAFFPQALLWNPDSPYITHGYHDVPTDAPQLASELLRGEWPARQLLSRVYHYFFPLDRAGKANFEIAAQAPASPTPHQADTHSKEHQLTTP